MATSARVTSVDALKRFRVALVKFCEAGARALSEADAEINRTLDWVEHTQTAHWRREVTTRTNDIAAARSALFRREMRSMTDNPGATEERYSLTTARTRLREAEDRRRTVAGWSRRLREEADRYNAAAERLAAAVHAELPEASIRLDHMIRSLEQYLAVAAPAKIRADDAGERGGSARAQARGAAPVAWWRRLRERARLIHIPGPPASRGTGDAPTIDDADLAARLGDVAMTPLRGRMIAVEQGALAASEFFLHRRGAEPPGDVEWLIGLTEGEPRPAVWVGAATAAERLGNQASLLHLPAGWLAVVRDGRIRLIADDDERERLLEKEGE